jgi:2,5-dioxopentanoate dehydrogenase
MLTGHHLIAGNWVASPETALSSPASGAALRFSVGGAKEIDAAVTAAEAAFPAYAALTREARAAFLDCIADEIEARGAEITAIGTSETGLPAGRLEGERGRTTGQLRLFAAHIRKGDFLDRRTDAALPERQPAPRPEIRMMQRPIGPVAVFGASNFPLAFSTAGGDTASALAAGCTVVVKGHPAHPGTGEIVAQAIDAAIKACGLPAGVFSLVQSNGREAGEALVKHPLIRAVGFTGSLGGGRALFDLCAQRPEPIPFFGELGSVNPMFVLPAALAARGAAIAAGWAGSLTMGAGQFCTNPGIVVMIEGPEAEAFTEAAHTALTKVGPQTMLSDGIAEAYRKGSAAIAASKGVREILTGDSQARSAAPNVFETSAVDFTATPALAHEVFGPLGMLVRVRDVEEMRAIAAGLEGQLTCSLHLDAEDIALAQTLMPILERKAGRLLANGFPTGVEVGEAQVHGGPYPASTNFGATSVGTMAIRRWLRPIAYQNIPADLLPEDLA